MKNLITTPLQQQATKKNNVVSITRYRRENYGSKNYKLEDFRANEHQGMCVGSEFVYGQSKRMYGELVLSEPKSNQARYKKIESAILAAAAVVVTIILFVLVGSYIQDRARARALFDNSKFESQEMAYQQSVCDVLKQYCLADSGVMLTHTVDLEGNRAYRMEIHNNRLGVITDDMYAEVADTIEAIAMTDSFGSEYDVEVILTK